MDTVIEQNNCSIAFRWEVLAGWDSEGGAAKAALAEYEFLQLETNRLTV